jgi:hypothetical protein
MERAFERVYTMTDWYDGPLAGVADFDGAPHAYRLVWREDCDDDRDPEEHFELSPVPADVVALVLEDHALWARWQAAYLAGAAPEPPDGTECVLPADLPRRLELNALLRGRLEVDPARRLLARGEFRARPGVESGPDWQRAELEVRWTPRGAGAEASRPGV